MVKKIHFKDLENQELHQVNMQPGAMINGVIKSIDGDFAIIDAKLKSEGRVSLKEFINEDGEIEAKINDEYEFYLDCIDDGYGHTVLSREKAVRARVWKKLEDAYEQTEQVSGKITERRKGGFIVDLGSIKAFLPGSHAFIKSVREMPEDLEGKIFNFRIVKMEKRRNNVVVSRRLVHELESNQERRELLESMKLGDMVTGTVKNLTEYGAFIDLGGIDGLLHITDISWKRIKHPNEVIKIGQELQVKVLNHDRDNNRVSLGLKQMIDDPWVNIDRRYPVGTRIFGKVTNMTDYGCFVEIEDGIEGLVHMSEMDWSNKTIHPSKIVSLNAETEVMVLEVDEERRRISLGIKQTRDNPWTEFSNQYNVGDKIEGEVRSVTDFGVFIGFEGGIDGLVHVNDISWTENNEEKLHEMKKGDVVKTTILAIDSEKERISLGIKQLENNPFETFTSNDKNAKGTRIVMEVTEFNGSHVVGKVEGNLPAIIKKVPSEFKVSKGDLLESFLVTYDRKGNILILSLTEPDAARQHSVKEKKPAKAQPAKATLGDIMKQHLDQDDKS